MRRQKGSQFKPWKGDGILNSVTLGNHPGLIYVVAVAAPLIHLYGLRSQPLNVFGSGQNKSSGFKINFLVSNKLLFFLKYLNFGSIRKALPCQPNCV